MLCFELRRRMLDFVLRELPLEEFDNAMDHVAACGGCSRELVELRKRCGISAGDIVRRIIPNPRNAREIIPSSNDSARLPKQPPVAKIANVIIAQAIGDGADRIHIEPTDSGVRVLYYMKGRTREVMRLPSYIYEPLIGRIRSMASMHSRSPARTGRATVRHGGRQVELTVAAYPTDLGERLVMRLTPRIG